MKYKIISAKEMCELIYDKKVKVIGFMADNPNDFTKDEEPDSGWYGIGYSEMFDDYKIVFGYWGQGIIEVSCTIDTVEDVFEALREFWKDEFNEDISSERGIYIDSEDLKKKE